jgi:hypothetical protein
MGLVDRLREERGKQLRAKSLTMPVPGYSGLLHVRYSPPDWGKLAALLAAAGEGADGALQSNVDALYEAVHSLRVKTEEGELVSLADELRRDGKSVNGEVRFDEVAVETLGLTVFQGYDEKVYATKPEGIDGEERAPKTGTEILLALFAGAVSPELAIVEHGDRLGSWLHSAQAEVNASLLGG